MDLISSAINNIKNAASNLFGSFNQPVSAPGIGSAIPNFQPIQQFAQQQFNSIPQVQQYNNIRQFTATPQFQQGFQNVSSAIQNNPVTKFIGSQPLLSSPGVNPLPQPPQMPTIGQYVGGQIVKPLEQGLTNIFQAKNVAQAGQGALQTAGGAFSATPQGFVFNASRGGIAAGINVAKGQPVGPALTQGITKNPSIGSALTKNPILAMGIDLASANPEGTVEGLIKGGNFVKALKATSGVDEVLSNDTAKTVAPILGKIDSLQEIKPEDVSTLQKVATDELKIPQKYVNKMNVDQLASEIKTAYSKNQEYAYRQVPGYQVPGMGLVSKGASEQTSGQLPTQGEPVVPQTTGASRGMPTAQQIDQEINTAKTTTQNIPDASLINSAKGIGVGMNKIPMQTSSVGGAFNEIKGLFSPGADTKDVQNALRANRGMYDLNNDQLIRQSQPLTQEWNKLTPEDHVAFIQKMETGVAQANSQLDQLASQYRTRFDQDYKLAQTIKPNLPYMDNYFSQSGVWANPAEAKSFYQKFSLGGTPGATQQRVFPTIQDGINAGLQLKETNPETLALTSRTQLLKAQMAQQFTDQQLAKGVPQAKIDAVLNQYLSPGLNSKAIQTIRQANGILNSVELGLSGFHIMGTSINASVSKASLAVNDLLTGHPLDAMKHTLQTPTATLEYLFKGNKIMSDVKAGNMTPDIQNIVGGGGRLKTPDIYSGVGFQDALSTIQKPGIVNKLKGALQTVPATINSVAKPVMEWWVPRLKAGVAADLISTNLKKLGANATEEQINAVRSNAIDSVDNRFGQLNQDNLFWNKTVTDLMSLGMRSPGWNIGTVRELGGGVKDAFNLKQLFAGGGISDRASYTIALPVVVGMLGAMFQYVHTGQGPQSIKDYFYPKTGQTDPKTGNPERVSFPTYAKDVYGFMTNPLQTVANKASPIASIGTALLQNKDYYGNSISDPNANPLTQAGQKGMYLIKSGLPFTATSASNRINPNAESTAESFMGINKAPGTITNPGQQDYYNAKTELQNLDNQRRTTIKQMNAGTLTSQQGQSQLQDIQSRIDNANTVISKGVQTATTPQQQPTGIVSVPGGKFAYTDSHGVVHTVPTLDKANNLKAVDDFKNNSTDPVKQIGDVIYIRDSANNVSMIKKADLTPGTGTDPASLEQQANAVKQAQKLVQNSQAFNVKSMLTQQAAFQMIQSAGGNPQQAYFGAVASLPAPQQAQFVQSYLGNPQNGDFQTRINTLVSNNVLNASTVTAMNKAGLINLNTATALKQAITSYAVGVGTSAGSGGTKAFNGAQRIKNQIRSAITRQHKYKVKRAKSPKMSKFKVKAPKLAQINLGTPQKKYKVKGLNTS